MEFIAYLLDEKGEVLDQTSINEHNYELAIEIMSEDYPDLNEDTIKSMKYFISIEADDDARKLMALCDHLGLDSDDTRDIGYDGSDTFTYMNNDYCVLTDSEAEEKYDDYIDNYIDEVVLREIPDQYHIYFDNEKFFRDYKYNGSRGNSLAGYDGEEVEVNFEGYAFYIYKN